MSFLFVSPLFIFQDGLVVHFRLGFHKRNFSAQNGCGCSRGPRGPLAFLLAALRPVPLRLWGAVPRMDPVQDDGDLWKLLRIPKSGPDSPHSKARRGPHLGERPWEPDPHGAVQALSSLIRFTGEPRRVEFGEPSEKKEVISDLEDHDIYTELQVKAEEELLEANAAELNTDNEEISPPWALDSPKAKQTSPQSGSLLRSLWSSPTSQLRKLIRGPFWDFSAHMDSLPPAVKGGFIRPRLRPPKSSKEKKKRGRKSRLHHIKELVNKFDKRERLLREFESQFLSSSSKAPKESRANFVMQILEDITDGTTTFPLTSRTLKLLSAMLWKAGYKSAEAYLAEAKQIHIEAGHHWTQLLELCYKKCKAGVARNRGPRVKAPEVPADVRKSKHRAMLQPKVPMLFPREVFSFAMVWMLRRIELEEISVDDLVINSEDKEVKLLWKKSKCDQTAGGTMRVLKCCCAGDRCDSECPYWVSLDLVQKVLKKAPGTPHFCLQKKNPEKKASKTAIVKSWAMAFNMKVTGHSARRSGALNYIRLGWTIPQVSYLGRWRSGVIYDYAQEALQEKPVNEKETGPKRPVCIRRNKNLDTIKEEQKKECMAKLQLEIDEYKRDAKKSLEALEKEVGDLARNFGTPEGKPPNVMSIHSKLVHKNVTPVTNTPPALWRTVCGWYFRDGGFCFVTPNTQVSCSKCLTAVDARCREV